LEISSPGHDELRRALFLLNGAVMGDHSREQVSSTPWGPFVRLGCPLQTLVEIKAAVVVR
jgi:hypothetical protein